MRKKMLVGLLACVVSGLFGCQRRMDKPVYVKEKLPVGNDFNAVCVQGNLYETSKKNRLPIGFSGNHPQDGIYEIGGKAGDPNGAELPLMSLSGSKMRLGASITFEKNIQELPFAEFRKKLGYSCSMVKPDNTFLEYTYLEEASSFSNLFNWFEEYGVGHDKDTVSDGVDFKMTAWVKANAILLMFDMPSGYRLKSLSFIYGDYPLKITNAALFPEHNPPEEYMNIAPSGTDCRAKSYTRKIDASKTYHIQVQKGTIYSKDFLLSQFVVRDIFDGSEEFASEIKDPGNYFTAGDKADIGESYPITLVAKDRAGNTTELHLVLDVVDTMGPLIQTKESDFIKTGYNTDFQQEDVVSNYFYVQDYSQGPYEYSMLLKNGDPLPKAIGTFPSLFRAKDQSGNVSEYPVTLEFFDDVPPVIETEHDELNLSEKVLLSLDQLLSMFHIFDEIDGELEGEIVENTYSANARQAGKYVFTMEAKDKSGNIARKSINIQVNDEEGPVFYTKEGMFTVMQGEIPSLEEIVSSLIRQGVIEDEEYLRYEIVQGGELSQDLSIGKHRYTLELEKEDQSRTYADFVLDVKEKRQVIGEEKEEKKPKELNFFQKILQWFKDLFRKIKEFFQNLFGK